MEKKAVTSPETESTRKRLQAVMDRILRDHPTADAINQRQAEKGFGAGKKAAKEAEGSGREAKPSEKKDPKGKKAERAARRKAKTKKK